MTSYPPPGGADPSEPQYGQPQPGQFQPGQPQPGQPQYPQPQYGQPQYGQPQYGQPPGYPSAPPGYGYPPPARGTNGMAIAGFILVLLLLAARPRLQHHRAEPDQADRTGRPRAGHRRHRDQRRGLRHWPADLRWQPLGKGSRHDELAATRPGEPAGPAARPAAAIRARIRPAAAVRAAAVRAAAVRAAAVRAAAVRAAAVRATAARTARPAAAAAGIRAAAVRPTTAAVRPTTAAGGAALRCLPLCSGGLAVRLRAAGRLAAGCGATVAGREPGAGLRPRLGNFRDPVGDLGLHPDRCAGLRFQDDVRRQRVLHDEGGSGSGAALALSCSLCSR